jgi:hypothetical protein
MFLYRIFFPEDEVTLNDKIIELNKKIKQRNQCWNHDSELKTLEDRASSNPIGVSNRDYDYLEFRLQCNSMHRLYEMNGLEYELANSKLKLAKQKFDKKVEEYTKMKFGDKELLTKTFWELELARVEYGVAQAQKNMFYEAPHHAVDKYTSESTNGKNLAYMQQQLQVTREIADKIIDISKFVGVYINAMADNSLVLACKV